MELGRNTPKVSKQNRSSKSCAIFLEEEDVDGVVSELSQEKKIMKKACLDQFLSKIEMASSKTLIETVLVKLFCETEISSNSHDTFLYTFRKSTTLKNDVSRFFSDGKKFLQIRMTLFCTLFGNQQP